MKKRTICLLCLFVMVVVSLCGCGKSYDYSGWKTFEVQNNQNMFKYPSDWKTDKDDNELICFYTEDSENKKTIMAFESLTEDLDVVHETNAYADDFMYIDLFSSSVGMGGDSIFGKMSVSVNGDKKLLRYLELCAQPDTDEKECELFFTDEVSGDTYMQIVSSVDYY